MIVARHITPQGVIEFTDHAEYQAYLKANTPQPTAQEIAKEAIKARMKAIREFTADLYEDYEADNILLGIGQETQQTRKTLKANTKDLIDSLKNGELDLVLGIIATFPANAKDGKYITDSRLQKLQKDISDFITTIQ
jgi:hypothetical protein